MLTSSQLRSLFDTSICHIASQIGFADPTILWQHTPLKSPPWYAAQETYICHIASQIGFVDPTILWQHTPLKSLPWYAAQETWYLAKVSSKSATIEVSGFPHATFLFLIFDTLCMLPAPF